jgi:hypothetical protein
VGSEALVRSEGLGVAGEHWWSDVQVSVIIFVSTATVTADRGFLCDRAAVHGTR